MLTPEGEPANKMDKVMLQGVWAKHLGRKHSIIHAGMGRPTYPLHPDTIKFLAEYWKNHNGEAIDYGHPQGDLEAREIMAKAMSEWYGFPIEASNVLFTVGGAGGLRSIFSSLKTYYEDTPNFRVITPFPYYTLYAENDLRLHPIYVMNESGYALRAEALLKSIQTAEELAKKDSGHPRAVLLCDPNNPLGSVIGEKELKRIAKVLRLYPKLAIILDEAYAEMVLDGTKHVSLLAVAPDLKNRIIVMRSATKGLSAAGERMAVTMAFDPVIMNSILEHSILNYGHAPRSLQMAYATTMENFTDTYRIEINNFYRQKVDYVSKRLLEMGAAMPDKQYQVKGTFYILADFSELLGEVISSEATKALQRKGKVKTDEDIAYNLLFTDSLMISPASYYGIERHRGYLRITCSAELDKLKTLMDRLEERLKESRLKKQDCLENNIKQKLAVLMSVNPSHIAKLPELKKIINPSVLELKHENQKLEHHLLLIKRLINRDTVEGKIRAATIIQAAYRGHKARLAVREINHKQDTDWFKFVARVSPEPNDIRSSLERLNVTDRLKYEPWKEYLKENEPPVSAHFLMSFLNNYVLNPYVALLVFVGLASGVVGVLGLASVSVIGLTAASIVGVGSLAMGVSFFSQSLKKHFSCVPSLEKEGPQLSPC